MLRRATRLLLFSLALLPLLLHARPSDASNDDVQAAAIWLVNEISMPLGERLSFHLMLQNRWTDDVVDAYERTVLRPWAAVALPHRTEIAVGYDLHEFAPSVAADDREHRAWQRVAWAPKPWSRVSFPLHFWLEERFFDGAGDVAVRGRFNVGVHVDLAYEVDMLVRNEFFVNFNSTSRVPSVGFGENQFVVGFLRPLGRGVKLQLGYLQQYRETNGRDRFDHAAVAGFVWQTPRLADWL